MQRLDADATRGGDIPTDNGAGSVDAVRETFSRRLRQTVGLRPKPLRI